MAREQAIYSRLVLAAFVPDLRVRSAVASSLGEEFHQGFAPIRDGHRAFAGVEILGGVDAHGGVDGGVEVSHAAGFGLNRLANCVCCANHPPMVESAPGKNNAERFLVVVSSSAGVINGGASEFHEGTDQGSVQQVPIFEVLDERG